MKKEGEWGEENAVRGQIRAHWSWIQRSRISRFKEFRITKGQLSREQLLEQSANNFGE